MKFVFLITYFFNLGVNERSEQFSVFNSALTQSYISVIAVKFKWNAAVKAPQGQISTYEILKKKVE